MAVGKGSMARASKAAEKKTDTKVTTKRTTAKKVAPKKEEATIATSAVVAATSEQVMKQIVYQKSSQILDREPEANETFGVGEAMPIYFF